MYLIQKNQHASSRRLVMRSLAVAISSITLGSSGFVVAQTAEQELEEITVTGSRIRQSSGFTTPVPITAVTTNELYDLAPGSTISEQLDALPQFFGNQSLERSNVTLTSQSGSSSLDLRNLGSNRTLVLFDGYRVVPSSKEGAVHVDFFPTALVRTVDVVTGGASAAYGADAVGGVTNFVLDRQFEGFKFSAGSGMTELGDGKRYNISAAGGRKFGDRLNVIASVQRNFVDEFSREADEIPNQKRVGWVTNPAWRSSAPPGTNPQRLTLPNVVSTASAVTGLITGTNSPLDWHKFTEDGSAITPYVITDIASLGGPGSTQSMAGGPEAEVGNRAWAGGVDSSGVETNSAFLGLEYQLSDSFSVFGQAIWGRTVSSDIQERGAAWLFSNQYAPTVYIDNAYLPEEVRQVMLDKGLNSFRIHKNGNFLGANDLGMGKGFEKVFRTTSLSTGFDWDLPFNDWHLRGVYQSGETERVNTFAGKWRMDRAYLAMDAVRDPATGAIVCRVQVFNPTPEQLAASPAVQGRISSRSAPGAVKPGDPGAIPLKSPIGLDNTVRDCVPFNIMGTGQMSQSALDYTSGDPKIGIGNVDQDFAELLLNGELYEGWGYGPVGFAAGLTWRDQSFSDNTEPYAIDELGPPLNDPALGIKGIPIGYTGGSANLHYISTLPNLSGDAGVWEWFTEVNVPVWEGMIGNQAQRFSLDAAFRQSDYDRSGKVDSWKVGIDYQILNDVRLRYTLSTDVREPTFSELYDAQPTLGSILDPRYNGQRFEITIERGGNPDLSPEEAETTVAGIVWTPSGLLEGLQASVDYFDVAIDGSVGLYGIQRIADECFLKNLLCDQVRLAANGEVTKIFDVYQNVAQSTVEGVDLEIAYRIEPNFFNAEVENLTLRFLTSYIKERTDTPLEGSARDISGTNGNPDLTGLLTASYSVGPWGFQMQGRYIDSVAQNGTWVEGVDVDDNSLPSITWWNGRVGYSGETANGSSWQVALNVQNMFDKQQIIVPSVSSRGATQGLTGDLYGRRYNLSLNYNF